jgi:hypothetical protein
MMSSDADEVECNDAIIINLVVVALDVDGKNEWISIITESKMHKGSLRRQR